MRSPHNFANNFRGHTNYCGWVQQPVLNALTQYKASRTLILPTSGGTPCIGSHSFKWVALLPRIREFCSSNLCTYYVVWELVWFSLVSEGVCRASTAELIPQSLQLQKQMLASLGWCHRSGECTKLRGRRGVFLQSELWRCHASFAWVAAAATLLR
jgi:hypothetical protein